MRYQNSNDIPTVRKPIDYCFLFLMQEFCFQNHLFLMLMAKCNKVSSFSKDSLRSVKQYTY